MGLFPPSKGNLYILVVVDYVSKWVKAIATPKNESKTIVKFVHKNIHTHFGASKTITSDERTYFSIRCFQISWRSTR